MKFLVLGAGMMGRAVAYDLAKASQEHHVLLADIDHEAARGVAASIGSNVQPCHLDVRDTNALAKLLDGCAVVVSAVSYSVNEIVTRAAIRAGVHMCDMGGNNDVVDRQMAMDGAARERNITILPNCGLAPGLINILAAAGMEHFDTVDSIALRVGGLPRQPRPPLNYQIVFSAEGLINEYIEPAEILENGDLQTVPSMTGLEELDFPAPYGRLEAFYTSGGLSTLTRTLRNKVRHLDYKTIRYPGHCERFRVLLDLGFATSEPLVTPGGGLRTSRELFTELLKRKLGGDGPDVVLARATLRGAKGGKGQTLVYECVDVYDEETRITAMMRTTAFPTSVAALLLADGTVTRRGVFPPEQCIPGDRMIAELRQRGINITTQISHESLP
jgi:lysine 6-dehydrogenase